MFHSDLHCKLDMNLHKERHEKRYNLACTETTKSKNTDCQWCGNKCNLETIQHFLQRGWWMCSVARLAATQCGGFIWYFVRVLGDLGLLSLGDFGMFRSLSKVFTSIMRPVFTQKMTILPEYHGIFILNDDNIHLQKNINRSIAIKKLIKLNYQKQRFIDFRMTEWISIFWSHFFANWIRA